MRGEAVPAKARARTSALRTAATAAALMMSAACASRPASLPVEPIIQSPSASEPEAALRVRNNHDFAYRGPVRLFVDLPDGSYAGTGGRADVRQGVAHAIVEIAGRD